MSERPKRTAADTCTVTSCDNPSDGWFVCRTCSDDFTHVLVDFAGWLIADLNLVVTGQTRYVAQAGKSAETPLMFNAKAAEVRGSLVITLDGSAAIVAEANRWERDYRTPSECAQWLARNITAVRLHPEGGDIVTSLNRWYDDALWVVDRPAQRQYLGTCSAEFEGVPCDKGRVYGKRKKPEARCDVCGSTYDADDMRAYLLGQLDDRIVTAAEFAHLATYLGLPMDRMQVRKRVNQWHARKQVERRNPHDDDAAPTFRFADLLALIYRDEQMRTAGDTRTA